MIQDLFKNFDCFQLSIFLYKPQGGKIHYGPVWDFDIGAANCQHEHVHSPTGSYTMGSTIHGQLMQMSEFALHYKERVQLHLATDWNYLMSNLHLVLNEEKGTLAPTEAVTVQKPSTPQTGDNTNLSWWWLLAVLSATCIVVLETYRRKKKID